LAYGVNLDCGKFLFNLEYARNTTTALVAGVADSDTNTINGKCGYALFADGQSYLALTAGYHQTKSDSAVDRFSGVLVGLTAVNNLSEKSRLEGSLGYSLSGTCKFQDPDTGVATEKDTDILLFQVKYSYFFTENFGLGIGYQLTQHKYNTIVNVLGEMMDMNIKVTNSGPTVGVTYRF
jgi:hypothetical protein